MKVFSVDEVYDLLSKNVSQKVHDEVVQEVLNCCTQYDMDDSEVD